MAESTLLRIGSWPKRTVALTTFWTVVFFLAIAIRVVFGSPGEGICIFLLVAGTTFAFTAAANGSIRIGDGHGDGDEATEPQPTSHSHSRDDASEIDPTVTGTFIHTDDTDTDIYSDTHTCTCTDTHTCTHTTVPSTGAARDPVATATATATPPSSARQRLPFLDNLRVFLTAVVVTHHVACAFGGCGTDAWYLEVDVNGGPPPGFHQLVGGLALLNQSYFMPLFFFVSAYFVPSSYERAGGSWERFATTKRKRLVVPALVECFVVAPLAIILSGNDGDDENTTLVYFPHPGVAWFLFWLLLFQIVYASFRLVHQDDDETTTTTPILLLSSSSSSSTQQNTNVNNINFEPLLANPNHVPSLQSTRGTVANEEAAADATDADASAVRRTTVLATNGRRTIVTSTWLRMACGAGICGVALLPFLALQFGSFASMPISSGSLTCNFFMFHLGLEAHTQRWFETKPLVEQLDIHPLVLALVVVAEYMAMATISSGIILPIETWWPLYVIAGMFCLDMSLLVLVVFQRWCNVETRVTRFFARGAYAVYLTHPIVVVGTTLLYMRICNYYYGYYYYDGNDNDDTCDASHSDEDHSYDYYYPLGFIFVNIVSHLINWPLAYFLAQLPFLKTII